MQWAWFILLLSVIVVLGSTEAPAEPTTQPGEAATQPAVTDERFNATLKEAGSLDLASDASQLRFLKLMQSVASRFQTVRVGEASGKATWIACEMNHPGAGVDAVRLRTPVGAALEMQWAFYAPEERLVSWFIIPVEGTMQGFRDFHRWEPSKVQEMEIPKGSLFVLQDLSAKSLKPDTEYLIGFKIKGTEPMTVNLTINLVKVPQRPDDPQQIARSLGLRLKS